MLSLLALAFAGPVEQELARDHLLLGRPDVAYDLLRLETADTTSPDVWLPFLASCEAIGLGHACRAETAIRADTSPDLQSILHWHDRLRDPERDSEPPAEGAGELERAAAGHLEGVQQVDATREYLQELAHADPDAAAEAALVWLDEHPAHPDVVLPLFAPDLPPRAALGKLRKQVDKRARRALKSASDPAVALRWHRLLRGMHSENAALWADQAVALGVPRPDPDLPTSRATQVKRAAAVLAGEATMPTGIPAEREGVALKLATQSREAGRRAEAIRVLRELLAERAEINLSLELGQLLLEVEDFAGAREEAERSLRLAVGPWPTDRVGQERIGRRIALAEALALRGEARERLGDTLGAVTDLMVANQLALQPTRPAPLERAMEAGRYELATVKASLETPRRPAQEVALEQARDALAEEAWDQVVQSTDQAIQVLCLPTHRRARLTATLPSRPELASAFALRAAARRASGDIEGARVDLGTAVLLVPWSAPADWWEALAELQGDGHDLLARAMVEQTGEGEARTPRAVTGLPPTEAVTEAVSAALVSSWMQGREELEAPPVDLAATGARVISIRQRVPSSGPASTNASGAPVVNRPFPLTRFRTSRGEVRLAPGRIHLVTFVRADSPSSQRMLHELRELARNVRTQGIDVSTIGVSIDTEATVQGLNAQQREVFDTLTWAPELQQGFGIKAVPTTWVVDASGIARFVHVGYLGPSQLVDEIRYVNAH